MPQLRQFNPNFIKQFFPEKHLKYVQTHHKYKIIAGGYSRFSKVTGLNDEYVRLGNAIKNYGFIERKGMKMVENAILKDISDESKQMAKVAPKRFLFYGPNGVGKRMSIAACLNSCYGQVF